VNTGTESITQTPLKTGSEHRYRINNTNPLKTGSEHRYRIKNTNSTENRK
jgi:hypothetical protein